MRNAIEIINLKKQFGKQIVLNDISVNFEIGKIHGIVGRNGSGKTVLLKCILGFLRPTSGSIFVFRKHIGKDCDFAQETGMMIETPGFIDTENGKSNLKWLCNLSSTKSNEVEEIIKLVGLDPNSRKSVGKYSLGMRQRLGIAQALINNPKLLVLDEPMNGLDNNGVEEMRKLFCSLRDNGTTILLCSHNPLDISYMCDTVHEMNAGVLSII